MANIKKDEIDWKHIFSANSLIHMILGVVCAAIAYTGFMIPNKFLDGGVTGLSILVHEVFHMNIGLVLLVLNLPFIYLGYLKIGKTFAVQTFIAIALLVIILEFLHIKPITDDKVLIAFFGGLFIGLGIGLVIKSGGVLDGMEVIADYTNQKLGFTVSEITMVINSVIILLAALAFGIEAGMYSILTYFTAMKTSDYIVDGLEEYTALTVISKDPEIIKECIVKQFGKAISVYKGERGYLPDTFEIHQDTDIIVTVVTRLELHRIKKAVSELDPQAFMFVQIIKEVKGGMVKQKVGHR